MSKYSKSIAGILQFNEEKNNEMGGGRFETRIEGIVQLKNKTKKRCVCVWGGGGGGGWIRTKGSNHWYV